jgi:hypothetical protein
VLKISLFFKFLFGRNKLAYEGADVNHGKNFYDNQGQSGNHQAYQAVGHTIEGVHDGNTGDNEKK